MACLIPRPETPHQPLCIPKPGQLLQTTMAQVPPTRVLSDSAAPIKAGGASKMQRLNNQKSWAGQQGAQRWQSVLQGNRVWEAGSSACGSPYWPELMAISMMESLMCVAGSPCESTSSGGPGSEMSSRAETLGGESRVLEASDGGSGVESPLWTGALDSSDKERTGGFCGDRHY